MVDLPTATRYGIMPSAAVVTLTDDKGTARLVLEDRVWRWAGGPLQVEVMVRM